MKACVFCVWLSVMEEIQYAKCDEKEIWGKCVYNVLVEKPVWLCDDMQWQKKYSDLWL